VGDEPRGVAVSAAGVVYATVGDQIARFAGDGSVDYAWGPGGHPDTTFKRPVSVAVDGNGAVFVVDEIGHAVYRFADDGPDAIREDWTIGAPGFEAGEFNFPWGIAANDGRVFVADVFNERVQALDAVDGAFLFQWRAHDDPVTLWTPQGIAVAADGRIHVTSATKLFSFVLGAGL
jgi:outer membrane protein assembly factor BamB